MTLLFLLMACQTSQTGPSPAEATVPLRVDVAAHDRLIASLQAASATPLHSQRSGGRLRSMNLRVPAEGSDPRAQALGFFDAYGLLFGLDGDRQTLSMSAARDGQIRLAQSVDGVPVAHAEAIVLFDGDEIVGVTMNLAPAPAEGVGEVSLSVAEAISLARAEAGVERAPVLPPRLEWVDPALFGGVGEAGLAWRVSFAGGGGVVWIGAEAGETMAADPLRYDAEPDVDIIDAELEDPDFDCWNLWSGETVCDADSCDGDAPADAEAARLESLETWDHYLGTHSWLSWDDENEEIEIIVNVLNLDDNNNPVSNAFSDAGCGQLLFTPGMVTRDVYGHETGHMLASRAAGLLYEGESAAVHEHLGDAFGILYEEALGELDWDLGEGSALGIIRTPGVDTPLDYGGYVESDGPHAGSLVPSNAFRLIHAGGTYGGVVVEGLGGEKAGDLWFGMVRDRLPSCATFSLLRDATVAQAQALADGGQSGFTAQDVCQVKEAFKAVGVGVALGDLDCDGVADGEDTDMDADSIHEEDNCPAVPNVTQLDLDQDGLGDACDDDDDGDGVPDATDPCPDVPEPQVTTDVDSDGVVDHCEDIDQDGIIDELDSCPTDFNPSNNDSDGDGIGNACDPDRDGDEVMDDVDNCVGVNSTNQDDEDGDGAGDLCDNCLGVANPDQGDDDSDTLGDACDDDIDGDGVDNDDDNCDYIYNPDQADGDGDGYGTMCDADELAALEQGLPYEWAFPSGEPAFIALPVCGEGRCGDWLGYGARAELVIDADVGLWVGVVDGSGVMLASAEAGEGLDLSAYALGGALSLVIAPTDGSAEAEATVWLETGWQ